MRGYSARRGAPPCRRPCRARTRRGDGWTRAVGSRGGHPLGGRRRRARRVRGPSGAQARASSDVSGRRSGAGSARGGGRARRRRVPARARREGDVGSTRDPSQGTTWTTRETTRTTTKRTTRGLEDTPTRDDRARRETRARPRTCHRRARGNYPAAGPRRRVLGHRRHAETRPSGAEFARLVRHSRETQLQQPGDTSTSPRPTPRNNRLSTSYQRYPPSPHPLPLGLLQLQPGLRQRQISDNRAGLKNDPSAGFERLRRRWPRRQSSTRRISDA